MCPQDLTLNTLENNYTAYMRMQQIGRMYTNWPPELTQPSSSARAVFVSAENLNAATVVMHSRLPLFLLSFSCFHRPAPLIVFIQGSGRGDGNTKMIIFIQGSGRGDGNTKMIIKTVASDCIVMAVFFFCGYYVLWESNNASKAQGQYWNESLKSRCIPGGLCGLYEWYKGITYWCASFAVAMMMTMVVSCNHHAVSPSAWTFVWNSLNQCRLWN